MKYNFNQIFLENPNGTLTPRLTVQIGGAIFGPQVNFGPGVSFGGVNIFDFKGFPIEAEEENGILIIKGFYKL